MLKSLGYKPVERELNALERFRYGWVLLFIYGFTLLAMVSSTQIAKYSIRRARPDYLPHVRRMGKNLRKHEDGTFSMPSGDSAAAAVFCYWWAVAAGFPGIMAVLPLVCAGRVYYQCHWFGDTIFGSAIGLFWGQIFYVYMGIFIPLFRIVAN